jgi:hypothetical protein
MENLLSKLEVAAHGAFYISETDSPIQAFEFEDMGSFLESVDETAKNEFPGKREKRDFNELFAKLTAEHDWHNDFDKEQVAKFKELERLLIDGTQNRQVLRQGDVRVEIFIFGETADGKICGIKMHAVET